MNRFYDFRKALAKRPAAAALQYDPSRPEPPQVVAVGRGLTAEAIVEIAKAHGIPLYEDAGLVEALAKLEISDYIPRELYVVLAEVLAYIYRVDAEVRAKNAG